MPQSSDRIGFSKDETDLTESVSEPPADLQQGPHHRLTLPLLSLKTTNARQTATCSRSHACRFQGKPNAWLSAWAVACGWHECHVINSSLYRLLCLLPNPLKKALQFWANWMWKYNPSVKQGGVMDQMCFAFLSAEDFKVLKGRWWEKPTVEPYQAQLNFCVICEVTQPLLDDVTDLYFFSFNFSINTNSTFCGCLERIMLPTLAFHLTSYYLYKTIKRLNEDK